MDDEFWHVLRPTIRYRTAADVRAIPNWQWERWLLADPDEVPWPEFAAIREVQDTRNEIIKATRRRIEAQGWFE